MVLTTAHEGLSTRRYRTAAGYAAVEDETSPRILNGEQKFAQIPGFFVPDQRILVPAASNDAQRAQTSAAAASLRGKKVWQHS